MTKRVEDNLDRIKGLCVEYHVRRLAVFGSAIRDDFEPGRSDIDFVVEFKPVDPVEHMRAYFGLARELKALLEAEVDLVETAPIRNPYFLREIEETQAVVYDAA